MKERRKSARIKCRFPCEIVRGKARTAGTVVDISDGGLALRAVDEAEQGESIAVAMKVPGHGVISVEALVWHVRRARHRETGDTVHLLGLMLSKAPEAYFAIAKGARPTRAPVSLPPEPSPEAPKRPAAAETTAILIPYRIRLKHRSSPRTRVLCIDATSQAEACQIARIELDREWEILEARTGPTG